MTYAARFTNAQFGLSADIGRKIAYDHSVDFPGFRPTEVTLCFRPEDADHWPRQSLRCGPPEQTLVGRAAF